MSLRIVVTGFTGLLPAGGVTWDYIQYPLGFMELGHDVYYIEDTHQWPVHRLSAGAEVTCTPTVRYLRHIMRRFGLGDRWAYRDAVTGDWFGQPRRRVAEILRTADIFINVSCSTFCLDEYTSIPVRILLDTDPMFTQLGRDGSANEDSEHLQFYTHFYTFGENIGNADCLIPMLGRRWTATRQPICLSHWKCAPVNSADRNVYTTIMNYSVQKAMSYMGQSWGQKDVELQRYIDLPRRVPNVDFKIAMAPSIEPAKLLALRRHGWRIVNALQRLPSVDRYQRFIFDSSGEFSVAKETYVKARTGWFSCRSACYLAAGRPVITQDTGWAKYIRSGEGLFAISSIEDAVEAIRLVGEGWSAQSVAARRIAEEFFDSRVVLTRMLNDIRGAGAA